METVSGSTLIQLVENFCTVVVLLAAIGLGWYFLLGIGRDVRRTWSRRRGRRSGVSSHDS
jgi:hypothetical protein